MYSLPPCRLPSQLRSVALKVTEEYNRTASMEKAKEVYA